MRSVFAVHVVVSCVVWSSLVLSEMGGMERHLAEVYAGQQECPAMVDAVMLYRVWARQRELEQVLSLSLSSLVVPF